MSAELDGAMATLIQDLHDRGLLESTLFIWMDEMGRTPEISKSNAGREHFVSAWSIVMGGGGLKTGQFVGRTSKDGREVEDRPIRAHDFLATVCRALAIDPSREYDLRDGHPLAPGDSVPEEFRIRLIGKEARPVTEILPG
jgi:arylsulfatase A-like enzyme